MLSVYPSLFNYNLLLIIFFFFVITIRRKLLLSTLHTQRVFESLLFFFFKLSLPCLPITMMTMIIIIIKLFSRRSSPRETKVKWSRTTMMDSYVGRFARILLATAHSHTLYYSKYFPFIYFFSTFLSFRWCFLSCSLSKSFFFFSFFFKCRKMLRVT